MAKIFTAVLMKIQVFCDAIPCEIVNKYWYFKRHNSTFTLLGLLSTIILRNVSNYLSTDKAQCTRTLVSSILSLVNRFWYKFPTLSFTMILPTEADLSHADRWTGTSQQSRFQQLFTNVPKNCHIERLKTMALFASS